MNKVTKIITGVTFVAATASVGGYVKHIQETQHTVSVPMQEAMAFSQHGNVVILCYNAGATSKDVYDEVVDFVLHVRAVDPSGISSLPDEDFIKRSTESSKEWIRGFYSQFTQDELNTTQPSTLLNNICKPEEKAALDGMAALKQQYDSPWLFWK